MANLYDIAASDALAILTDSASGFGVQMTLTAPDGTTQDITGMAADIGLTVDPETGISINGRYVHASLPTQALTIGRPVGIKSRTAQPWLIKFALPLDLLAIEYKITSTMPDKLGGLVCVCEEWRA